MECLALVNREPTLGLSSLLLKPGVWFCSGPFNRLMLPHSVLFQILTGQLLCTYWAFWLTWLTAGFSQALPSLPFVCSLITQEVCLGSFQLRGNQPWDSTGNTMLLIFQNYFQKQVEENRVDTIQGSQKPAVLPTIQSTTFPDSRPSVGTESSQWP